MDKKSETSVDKQRLMLIKLNFAEKILREIKTKNEGSRLFSFGIMYGLIFGIIGNLYITFLFDFSLKFLSDNTKFILINVITILIIAALLITIKDNQNFKQKEKKLDDELCKTLDSIALLESKLGTGLNE